MTTDMHDANTLIELRNPKDDNTKSVLPLAKHAGFTVPAFRPVYALWKWLVQSVTRTFKRAESRMVAKSFLNHSDEVLADIGLTRGDVLYVLNTRSRRDPLERLRLLSSERRSITNADHRRRAAYLVSLLPETLGGAGRSADRDRKMEPQ